MTPRADPALRLLDELARADEAHAAMVVELDELAARAAALRQRADEISDVLASAPAERERLAAARGEAELDESRCRAVLAEAEAELSEAESRGDDERLLAARRSRVRAGDALHMAEKRARGRQEECGELERRVAAAEAEAPELERSAATLAGTLRGRPRVAMDAGREPRPGLAGIAEWANVARAALLVAQGGAIADRDAIVRQANELGSAVLGEAIVASSVAAVAGRVGPVLNG